MPVPLDPTAATSAALKAYYTADFLSGLADDAPITAWGDQSGTGNDLAEASSPPVMKTIAGQRAIYFDGTNQIGKLSPVSYAPTSYTWFIAFRRTNSPTTPKCLAHVGNNLGGRSLYLLGSNSGADANKPIVYAAAVAESPIGPTPSLLDAPELLTIVYDGLTGTWRFRTNGNLDVTEVRPQGAQDTANNASVILGARGSYNGDAGTHDKFTGYLYAVAMFDGVLSDLEIERIEQFLGDASGINIGNPAPPMVSAGGDRLGQKDGASITLTGTATAAAGSSIASVLWTQTAGTAVSLSGANTLTPTLTAPSDGSYHALTFQLTASGSNGAQASDSVSVYVVPSDSDDVLTGVPAQLRAIIGRQLRHGSPNNPYPFFDVNAVDFGKAAGTNFPSSLAGLSGDDLENLHGYWNYYDQARVQLTNYYRTGDPQFLTLFRKIADVFYEFLVDKWTDANNPYGLSPRGEALLGIMARAIDEDLIAGVSGTSAKWDLVRQHTAHHFNLWVWLRKDYPNLYFGVRDGGYALMHAAIACQSIPNSYPNTLSGGGATISDGAAWRAAMKAEVETATADYFLRLQYPDGSWRWVDPDADWFDPAMDSSPVGPAYGEVLFHVGLLVEALCYVHELTNDATLKTEIEAAVIAFADHFWEDGYRENDLVTDYPPTKWRGTLYSLFHGWRAYYGIGWTSTVSGELSNTATTIAVVGTNNFPSSGIITINGVETVTYTGKTLSSFTGVTRGTNGTAAVPHAHGSEIKLAQTQGTTLTADINATQTNIPVEDQTKIMFSGNGVVRIDSEVIRYRNADNPIQLTQCDRGMFGTSAASHSSGTVVYDASRTSTALTAPLTALNTTANVISTVGFPSSGAFKVGNEQILYSGKTASTLTGLTRGSRGSTAAPHVAGRPVFCEIVAPSIVGATKGDSSTGNGDVNQIRNARHNQCTLHHVFGQAYRFSGEPRFLTYGDEMFDASFGKSGGTRAGGWDGYYGLMDYQTDGRRAKEYNENYRASGYYLVDRLGESAANQQPSVSLTLPANGAVFTQGQQINLTASASDPDGTITKVEFYDGPTKIGEATSSPFILAWSGASAGQHSLKARATDNQGATAESTVATIQVTAQNSLPAVTLTSPVAGAQIREGNTITLRANASDPDGAISKVEFFDGDTKLGQDAGAPYSFDWIGASAGMHTLTARAHDVDNNYRDSVPVSVTVLPAPPAPVNLRAVPGDNLVTLTWD
ncbi:MAG: Ig-like domain-containing protein [Pyrinomonadaceae bacterium]